MPTSNPFFLLRPARRTQVTIGSQDLAASHSITQHVEVIEPHARDGRLLDLLQQYHGAKGRKNRVIIFVLYKKEAPRVEQLLTRKGWKVGAGLGVGVGVSVDVSAGMNGRVRLGDC